MNYIKKLELDNRRRAKVIDAMESELGDLRRYLTSAKFHEDPTVQVQDVLNRMDNVLFAAVDAADKVT
jgi:hypothetical protein